jgi:hypothetical protein
MKKAKTVAIEEKAKAKANTGTLQLDKIVVDQPDEIIAEYVSVDGKLKSVVRLNKPTSRYEIDFYRNKKILATESYAFHTRGYHENAAENYVNGIKKLHENEVLQLQEDLQQKNTPKSNTRVS